MYLVFFQYVDHMFFLNAELLLLLFLLFPPLVFRCICADGFEGEHCEINIDDCEDNDCENNSTCVDGINNYTCLCPPEYTGRKCSAIGPCIWMHHGNLAACV